MIHGLKNELDAEQVLAKVQATPGAVEAFRVCVERLEALWEAQKAFEKLLGWQVDGFTDELISAEWHTNSNAEEVAQFLMQDAIELWEGA